jgi:hypothetical protein
MKIRKWICPVLIVLCIAVSWIYEVVDDINTDTQAPQIRIETENLRLSVNDPEGVLLQGLRAEDDRDGDVTDSLIVESVKLMDVSGRIRVSYAALDAAGNVAKIEREAQYTDYISPRFALESPLVISDADNFDLLEMIKARDVIDGDISHRIRMTNLNGYSPSTGGSYDVLFRVTNSLGDTVQVQIPVEILPRNAHYNELALTEYLIYLPAGSEFAAEDYLKELVSAMDVVSLENGLPEGYSLKTEGDVDTKVPGVYVLDYQVSDSVYIWESRLIVVVEE